MESVKPISRKEGAGQHVVRKPKINEYEIAFSLDSDVWQSPKLESQPWFYPVYNFQDYYSYSPIPLILQKGYLSIDREFRYSVQSNRSYSSGLGDTVDQSVKRLIAPLKYISQCPNPDQFAQSLAKAMIKDLQMVESQFPKAVHAIIIENKDSLNLLCLPWNANVVALTPTCNYSLVCEFVKRNKIDIDVLKLEDHDNRYVLDEIYFNACRNHLQYCRSSAELVHFSQEQKSQTVFWIGQDAEVYSRSTPKSSAETKNPLKLFYEFFFGLLANDNLQTNPWEHEVLFQSNYTSFLRSITNCPVISIYHGPEVASVTKNSHVVKPVRESLCHKLGAALCGREVEYPSVVNAAPISTFRKGTSNYENFLSAIEFRGIEIRD